MPWNIVVHLAKLLGAQSIPLDRELPIDEFVERVQQALMTAPYGRELQGLKRFALRHRDPEFAAVFLAKEKLFEQQQREIRPPGSLGEVMYLVERTLGRLLANRALVPGALLAAVTLVATVLSLPALNLDFLKEQSGQELIVLPKSDRPADAEFEQRLLAAMQNPAIRAEFQNIRQPASSTALSEAIENSFPAVLAKFPLTDEERDELKRMLTENGFARLLAEQAALELRREAQIAAEETSDRQPKDTAP